MCFQIEQIDSSVKNINVQTVTVNVTDAMTPESRGKLVAVDSKSLPDKVKSVYPSVSVPLTLTLTLQPASNQACCINVLTFILTLTSATPEPCNLMLTIQFSSQFKHSDLVWQLSDLFSDVKMVKLVLN